MKNQTVRNNYVSKIEKLKQRLHPRDKILFLFNKVDETNYVIRQGQVNLRELIKYTANIFQGIFEPFRNTNPITKIWKKYNCDLVAFQSGTYTEAINGEKQFQEGPDVYPAILWQKILSIIKRLIQWHKQTLTLIFISTAYQRVLVLGEQAKRIRII